MIELTEDIDTNVGEAVSGELDLTAETLVTLYSVNKTGDSNNNRVTLQTSPTAEGDIWFTENHSIIGRGKMTINTVAKRVRGCVIEPEGSASVTTLYILAI